MNGSEQGISMGALLGTGDAVSVGSGVTLKKADSPLKNKEFSSVLGAEKERLDRSAASVTSSAVAATREADGAAAQAVVATDDAEIGLFFRVENGKLLPLDGQMLPLSDDITLSLDADGNVSLSINTTETTEPLPEGQVVVSLMGQELSNGKVVMADIALKEQLSELSGEGTEVIVPGLAVAVDKDGKPVIVAGDALRTTLASVTNADGQTAAVPRSALTAVVPEAVPAGVGSTLEMAQRSATVAMELAPTVNQSTPAQGPNTANPNLISALIPAQGGEPVLKSANPSAGLAESNAISSNSFVTTAGANTTEGSRAQLPVTQAAAIAVPVGKQGWGEQVMQRVMWMSSQNINRAEIALDPPELGPLQVRVSAQGEHMTVSFTSSHGVVRDALDQGLPRLRELMEQQGLNLADVDVSDQNMQRQARGEDADAQQDGGEGLQNADGGNERQSIDQPDIQNPDTRLALGLVDHYV